MTSTSPNQPLARSANVSRPSATPPKRTSALVLVLGALTAVAPLAVDMYVPGFPSMGESLHTSSSAIQLTMTAFLVGLVMGQLVIGPMSDGLGRRRLLLGGVIGFVLTSLLCVLAPNAGILTAARFLQGVSAAAGMVLSRAIITDRFHGRDIPRYFAILSQILGIAPVAAPVLGGAVLAVSTWRAIFVVLAAIGVLLVIAVVVKVPESLPPERRHRDGLGGNFRAMGRLVGHRGFMGYVLVLAFTSASLFSYISGSSFVFERLHGVSATGYSMIFAVNAIGMLLAGITFGRLASRVPLNRLLTVSTGVSLLGALAQVVLVATVGETFVGTWITLFVSMSAIGMVFPAVMSLGQTLGRATPGAASALMGGLQFLFGAITAPIVGLFGESSSMPMAIIILITLLLAVLALVTLARPWLRHGEIPAEDHSSHQLAEQTSQAG
ncbi:multidrug effflux MFS transporter [Streptosporangium amethystogenes]|uniref:multidrug effflux MFS transporter n=1 Tax=Streptosporangium amethystogenes TaxID=2002 RepID=UPI0037AA403F